MRDGETVGGEFVAARDLGEWLAVRLKRETAPSDTRNFEGGGGPR